MKINLCSKRVDSFKIMKDIIFIDKKKIGNLSYSFVIAQQHKTYYLYITFLHIKAKDNFCSYTFNDFDKAKSFAQDWFSKKHLCIMQEMSKKIKVMSRHNFKKVKINSRCQRQSLGSSTATQVVKQFRQTNVLSSIPKAKSKLKLKDIADLPKEDIVDFLRLHFL